MTVDGMRAVEVAVAKHPDVRQVAAVSPDTVAVVPVDFASAPAIRDHAWALLGDDRAPRTVALVTALPLDDTGQVDRTELRRVLAEDDPPASTYAAPATELETEVAEVLREVLDVPRVGLDDDFLELGGDSLRAVEVANLLAERAGLVVTLEDVFDAGTVREIVARAG